VKTTLKSSIKTTNSEAEAERRVFERRRSQLMRRYAGQYVAIVGGRVVDHGKDDEALAARMFRKIGDAPFYIGRVERIPTIYEVPSPEVAS